MHTYILYTTLHYTTFHSIPLDYVTLHYNTYIHTYVHTYIRTYVHTYIRTYVHSAYVVHPCIRTCVHASMHPCIHASMHTYIHPCMHACIHRFPIFYIPKSPQIISMIHVYFSMVIPVSSVRCKVAGCGWSAKRPRRPRSGAADPPTAQPALGIYRSSCGAIEIQGPCEMRHFINGNFRILKWRYILYHIRAYFLGISPYIGLI